jgi:GNAT superfamily N-acetyltransferase
MELGFETHYKDIPDSVLEAITGLVSESFGDLYPEPNFPELVLSKTKPMLILAKVNAEIVGFKLGYERWQGAFLSWMGCVRPEYRRQGIARELLRRQHHWCEEQEYEKVLTRSRNAFPEMLILNILEGFKITGTEMDGGEPPPTILFSKSLKQD